MYSLLAIDGGGLFGIGVANWLCKLGDCKFDYYAGTSVGAILAACYALGIKPEKVKEMFNSGLPKKIFSKPGFPQCLNPLRPAIYDNKEARRLLQEVFGDAKVCEARSGLVIVAWSYEKRKVKIFTRKYNGSYLIKDVVLASMSAPSYFPPVKLKDEEGNLELLGDGVVCGNDPALAGISAMLGDLVKIEDIKCLSICTAGRPGEKKIDISTKAGWLSVLPDIILFGNSSYTSYCAKDILGSKYLRVSPENLPSGSIDDFRLVPGIRKVWEKYDHSEALKFLNDTEG